MLVAGLEGQPEPARVKRGPRDEGRAQQHGLRQHGLSPHDKLPIRAQAGRLWGAPWITFTARVDHRGPWSLVELGVDCRRLLGVGCESARLIVWGRMKVGSPAPLFFAWEPPFTRLAVGKLDTTREGSAAKPVTMASSTQ